MPPAKRARGKATVDADVDVSAAEVAADSNVTQHSKGTQLSLEQCVASPRQGDSTALDFATEIDVADAFDELLGDKQHLTLTRDTIPARTVEIDKGVEDAPFNVDDAQSDFSDIGIHEALAASAFVDSDANGDFEESRAASRPESDSNGEKDEALPSDCQHIE